MVEGSGYERVAVSMRSLRDLAGVMRPGYVSRYEVTEPPIVVMLAREYDDLVAIIDDLVAITEETVG